ncbi:MAG TPA: M14 family zinc carboxypeptidase [Ignavibacteria bacterium]|nr:M14 family zinc carboxypeptidase [Ignavibacteria bacterium]
MASKILKLIFLFVLVLGLSSDIYSQEKYSFIKIFINSDNDIKSINKHGLFFDHAYFNNNEMEVYLSAGEVELLKKSGVPYQVVVEDWSAFYNERVKYENALFNGNFPDNVEDNTFNISHSMNGSMGGYLTYDQVIAKLDSMRMQYPNLISQKFSIGNSVEGRSMWTVKVSSSPNAPAGKPEVWIHSLIHAREPMSMMNMVYFVYWLLENYNTDPVARYILDNRELYFTPVFNPDGYEYNRSTNPNGGGMWRKNRKNNGNGSFGIDLNRNFGTLQYWNSPNGGSDTTRSSDTYRGTAPFSEPETQNARDFVNSRNFKNALSYHTYGNYYIRPWGWQDTQTPDEAIFHEVSEDMNLHNHFTVGRSYNTVNYGVRGVTDDWYYNDSGHAKIISMTPEVGIGSDGFWPSQARILPLCRQNVWSNIYFVLAAGGFVMPTAAKLNKENYTPGENGSIKVFIRNKGLMPASNVKVECIASSPGLNITTGTFNYANINSRVSDSVTFNFTVPANALNNSAYETVIRIKQNNDTSSVYTMKVWVPVGNGIASYLDSAENGLTGRWTQSGGWGTTTSQFVSPNNSFTDSPTGNYGSSNTRTLTLTNPLNISANKVTIVSFFRRNTIDLLDYAYFDVSADNGTTWSSAKFFNGTQSSWVKEVLDITSLAKATAQLKVRFSLVSNVQTNADGIYIDNIRIMNYNAVPTSVIGNNSEIPLKYSLFQNYPNPFNPSTSIKFDIPKTGFVTLNVYDLLGRQVAQLVNEVKNAGSYNMEFNASNLSSGVYYYKLETADFSDTKKMILIK